jgi:hypothetical protein
VPEQAASVELLESSLNLSIDHLGGEREYFSCLITHICRCLVYCITKVNGGQRPAIYCRHRKSSNDNKGVNTEHLGERLKKL